MSHPFEVLADRRSDFHVAPPSREDLSRLTAVTLDVARDELLEEIGDRALRELGFDWKEMGANYHFLTAPNPEGRRFQAPFSPYVASDGALTWVRAQIAFGWGFYRLEGVRVDDVVRTKEEGLFDGDPFALLLEERRGAGGWLPTWPELNAFLDEAGRIGVVYQSIKGLRSVVKICQRQWELRHATPLPLFVFILTQDSWRYPKLARLLDVSLDLVVDLLSDLGYEHDADDAEIYRLSASVPQAELRRTLEEGFLRGNPREHLRSFWRDQGVEPPG